jgi:hypothetical protein
MGVRWAADLAKIGCAAAMMGEMVALTSFGREAVGRNKIFDFAKFCDFSSAPKLFSGNKTRSIGQYRGPGALAGKHLKSVI